MLSASSRAKIAPRILDDRARAEAEGRTVEEQARRLKKMQEQ